MAEQLVNEFTVNRPIDEAWAVITDVEKIAPCLPGAQLQEIEGDVYRGVVKVKLGSITPQFKGQATFIDRDDPGHRAVLKAEGRDTGGRGNAAAEITAEAESLSPTSTRCVVTTDLHITGRVAQFGRGILGDVSKKLMAQFASNLNTMLDEQGSNGSANGNGDADAAAASASDTDTDGAGDSAAASASAPIAAAEAAAPAADAQPASTDLPPAGADQSGPQPRVRKIEGPDTEPVDLAGVAGPAILKRLAPLLAVLLVALIVLRRRR
jgi:carbon monoxide dehydrogenase subunit G